MLIFSEGKKTEPLTFHFSSQKKRWAVFLPSLEGMLSWCPVVSCRWGKGGEPLKRNSPMDPFKPSLAYLNDAQAWEMTVGFDIVKAGGSLPSAASHLQRNDLVPCREATLNTPVLANVCVDSISLVFCYANMWIPRATRACKSVGHKVIFSHKPPYWTRKIS